MKEKKEKNKGNICEGDWEIVPEEDIPKVLEAFKDKKCVSCYRKLTRKEQVRKGFYCLDCDPEE
ncbi:MAG: hypothetical protein ACFFDH_00245 [Promethearchaeota archaeon]